VDVLKSITVMDSIWNLPANYTRMTQLENIFLFTNFSKIK